ncbi:eukaryotic aspartyl protease family protein [Stylonychia lemnae]|uniref:Eukaryotic aspartyl protease family protein n=1 Tax=Stylonychia lemnae TaxID=5949 RepID=A0A078A2X4_STYLE|nr:eukaryotic aspartyl protease family protein [Stylonychia lemnae]|eukprot:CDW76633.1 eukaryotic aspartyl protease family protein [Stylonychia lemnae]
MSSNTLISNKFLIFFAIQICLGQSQFSFYGIDEELVQQSKIYLKQQQIFSFQIKVIRVRGTSKSKQLFILIDIERSFVFDLSYSSQNEYLSQIVIGSENIQNQISFDTTLQNYLYVKSKDCLNCTYNNPEEPQYDPIASTSHDSEDEHQHIKSSGKYRFNSKTFIDDVSIDQGLQLQAKQIKFEVVDTFNDLVLQQFHTNSILGLAPSRLHDENQFIYQLKQKQLIDQKIVSLLIGNDSIKSTIEIGGYNQSLLLQGDQQKGYGLHWIKTISDNQWQFEIQEIYYGGFSFYNSFLTLSILDSAQPYIIMPNKTFQVFLGMIKKIDENVKCLDEICKIHRPCESFAKRLDPIRLQLDDFNMFGIPAQEYLIQDRENSSQCILGLTTNQYVTQQNTFILGHVFMRLFYTVLDFENNKIGLGLHLNSGGYVEPVKSYRIYMIILIIIVVLLMVLAALLGFKMYKQRQIKRLAENEARILKSNSMNAAAASELSHIHRQSLLEGRSSNLNKY